MPISADEKLRAAFTSVLEVNPELDFDSLAYGQTDGWDSVAHMALISEIENVFDVMLTTDDVIGMSSFLKAKQILTTYGVNFR
jgi:acyl carrier protein